MIRKNITLSERSIEMIQEIIDVKGYSSLSAVLHQGVTELHARVFPSYMRTAKEVKTPAEKAREKQDFRQAEIDIVMEKQADICTALGGTVTDGEDGIKLCI